MRYISPPRCAAAVLLAAALVAPAPLSAHADAEPIRVTFESDAEHVQVANVVQGFEDQTYVVSAKAGQILCVALTTDVPTTAFFEILAPGGGDELLYNSATDGTEAILSLLTYGDYTIRVYLSGAPRDSGALVPYTLTVMLN